MLMVHAASGGTPTALGVLGRREELGEDGPARTPTGPDVRPGHQWKAPG